MSTEHGPRLPQLSEHERQRLVDRLLSRRRQSTAREIEPQPRTGAPFPLSFAQQRMWFLQQLAPQSATFSVGQGLWLSGPVNLAALQASLQDAVARHEALRTTFALVDGTPMQAIASTLDVPMPCEDARGVPAPDRVSYVTQQARAELRRPWDLARGPLVRARLWQVAEDEYAFCLGLHHIICDGWSLSVLLKELLDSYMQRAAGDLPAAMDAPIQYADYAVWQRRWLEGDGPSAQLAAWRRLLEGAPRLQLPVTDRTAATTGVARRVNLSPEVTEKVKALAVAQGVTPFMVLLAAYAALLARYSSQDDIVIGSPVASRTHAELENVVGCFMNPLPFRVNLSGNPTFREVIRRAAAVALDVYANQHVPFDVLVRMMDPMRQSPFPPLYQAMFLFHNFPFAQPRASASPLRFSSWPFLAPAADQQGTDLVSEQVFPVALDLYDSPTGIRGFLEYTSQFGDVLADAPADFQRMVEALVADPDRQLDSRPASRPDVTAAAAAQPFVVADVYDAFARQAAATPRAIAVVGGARGVSYGELSEQVSRLASRLQPVLGSGEAPVAVLLERSIDAIASLLAVLRAGRAYLPLDPGLPIDRLEFMLQHAKATVVLTSEDLLRTRSLPARLFEGRTVVRLDEAASSAPAAVPAAAVSASQLAYVLFTSGSSGRPKAVAIPRGALANYVGVARHRFALQPCDRVLQFASLSFDTAAEEIFPALTSGATLVLRSEAMLGSVPAFLAACGESGITVLDLPTAYWHELTAQIARGSLQVPSSVRLVILGGEKALSPRVQEWRAAVGTGIRLLNTYGPTESTIVATMHDLTDPAESDEVPIGLPVAHVEARVLDADARPVAAGAVGELWIGGAQLARGYLHDPALTAERFVPDPHAIAPGSRLYRTGDLASASPDGVLAFVGRADDQVKLRGFRIEPGEIEAVLLQHPAVLETFVTVSPDGSGESRLVAYVVGFEGREPGADLLRGWLQDRLPDYMIPSSFAFLDKLPRTVQGKVDRGRLPAVRWEVATGQPYQAPRNQVEARLAAVWAEVLECERVGVHDNFFDLGGHSLLVIKLHARICEAFGADLSPIDLFEFTTVSSQAERLAQGSSAATAAAGATQSAAGVQDRAARQRQAFRRMGK